MIRLDCCRVDALMRGGARNEVMSPRPPVRRRRGPTDVCWSVPVIQRSYARSRDANVDSLLWWSILPWTTVPSHLNRTIRGCLRHSKRISCQVQVRQWSNEVREFEEPRESFSTNVGNEVCQEIWVATGACVKARWAAIKSSFPSQSIMQYDSLQRLRWRDHRRSPAQVRLEWCTPWGISQG